MFFHLRLLLAFAQWNIYFYCSVDESKLAGNGLTLNGHEEFGDSEIETPSAVFSEHKASYVYPLCIVVSAL
jgi:hypothetical protein